MQLDCKKQWTILSTLLTLLLLYPLHNILDSTNHWDFDSRLEYLFRGSQRPATPCSIPLNLFLTIKSPTSKHPNRRHVLQRPSSLQHHLAEFYTLKSANHLVKPMANSGSFWCLEPMSVWLKKKTHRFFGFQNTQSEIPTWIEDVCGISAA